MNLSAADRSFVLCILERSRGASQAFFLGKVSVGCLLGTVKALLHGEGKEEFMKSSKVGSRAFIAQRCTNRHG